MRLKRYYLASVGYSKAREARSTERIYTMLSAGLKKAVICQYFL
jgi:hypothetical protein